MSGATPTKPFPALTPAQRLHIEIYGYVIIENLLTRSEVEILKDTIYAIEDKFRRTGELPGPNCFTHAATEDFFRVDNLPHLAPCFFDYLTHPRIVGMVEEIIGGPARLEQSDAHLRRPLADPDQTPGVGFHRGIEHRGNTPAYSHYEDGLYHFSFVKALTNLTDLGPDDGGTMVIPGTHKVTELHEQVICAAAGVKCNATNYPGTDLPKRAIIDAALADPSLVHQVKAPAGSTLLFFESLMHSAGVIKSGLDRVFILGGYMPTMFQAYAGYDPDPDFVKTISDAHRALLTGEMRFDWSRKPRNLATSAESALNPLS